MKINKLMDVIINKTIVKSWRKTMGPHIHKVTRNRVVAKMSQCTIFLFSGSSINIYEPASES